MTTTTRTFQLVCDGVPIGDFKEWRTSPLDLGHVIVSGGVRYRVVGGQSGVAIVERI